MVNKVAKVHKQVEILLRRKNKEDQTNWLILPKAPFIDTTRRKLFLVVFVEVSQSLTYLRFATDRTVLIERVTDTNKQTMFLKLLIKCLLFELFVLSSPQKVSKRCEKLSASVTLRLLKRCQNYFSP